jgi:hypothetical protein
VNTTVEAEATIMKVTMLLADVAQSVNGKLYILGGGWSVTGPDPQPMAVAIKVDIPWNDANKKYRFKLALFDEDGQAVTVPTPTGDRPVEVEGGFEAGRPAGLTPGTPLDFALAINLGPLPLRPGTRFAWGFIVDGEEKERVAFSTRPPQS